MDRIDTSFLDDEKEVTYELMDLEGRIVNPLSKRNTYTNDTFSLKAKEEMEKTGRSYVFDNDLGGGEIGLAQKIRAINTRTGGSEAVGMISIRFRPDVVSSKSRSNFILRRQRGRRLPCIALDMFRLFIFFADVLLKIWNLPRFATLVVSAKICGAKYYGSA